MSGVLLRFREERVAVMGSIEAMYYQVRVPEEDRDFLRFYWLFEKAARSLLDVCSSFRDSFFT